MVGAVRARYYRESRIVESKTGARLATYFLDKADPYRVYSWAGTDTRVFSDVVYYQLKALHLPQLKHTLGNLRFIETRARQAGGLEFLLRDYHDAVDEVKALAYYVLKDVLAGEDTANVSRQAQLQWLTEFMVFVGGNQVRIDCLGNARTGGDTCTCD